MMRRMLSLVLTLIPLGGCALVEGRPPAEAAAAPPPAAPAAVAPTLPALGAGQSAETLDTTTEAERTAATAAPATPATGGAALGQVVVALGSPAEQGFWLRAPIVTAAGKGRVVTASGATVAVDLQPGTGGALLSFAAFRALGLPLTDLPEVTVYAD